MAEQLTRNQQGSGFEARGVRSNLISLILTEVRITAL